MIRRFVFVVVTFLAFSSGTAPAQEASFKVLAFYSTNVESDHVDFAKQALQFFADSAQKNHFSFDRPLAGMI